VGEFDFFRFRQLIDLTNVRVGDLLDFVETITFSVLRDSLVFEHLLETFIAVSSDVANCCSMIFSNVVDLFRELRGLREAVATAGGEASLDAFPAPLGSSPALFAPPGLAGPGGTPLTPEVPAPAEPALGEPAALPPLPDDDPPAPCAKEAAGDIRIANAIIAEAIFMEISLAESTTAPCPCS